MASLCRSSLSVRKTDRVQGRKMEPIQDFSFSTQQVSEMGENANGKDKDGSDMSPEEEDLIHRLHNLLGDRWDLISGRLSNRQSKEVERYWRMKGRRREWEKNKIFKPVCVRAKLPLKKFINGSTRETCNSID